MAKYILWTEIKTKAENAEWWGEQTDCKETVKIFDSFDTAKSEMRKTVKRVVKKCDFAPFENGEYEPLRGFCDSTPHLMPAENGEYELVIGTAEEGGVHALGEIIRKIVSDPDYFCEDTDLDVKDTDDANWNFAFVGNKDSILADYDYYGKTLKMNIHNMTDSAKPYYFIYEDTDDDGRVVNAISVRLLTDAKKKKSKPAEQPKSYETVTFGRYVQDKGGKTASPLTWRVLDKKGGMTLLITENVIDNLVFSAERDNKWENSDWLNGEFIATAFDDEEREKIANVLPDDKIFLLSLDDYKKYFSDPKDARAGYSDYTRQKTSEEYQTNIQDPYAFWWLRTANETSPGYLCHVCDDGQINALMLSDSTDGVRPAMWVKTGD